MFQILACAAFADVKPKPETDGLNARQRRALFRASENGQSVIEKKRLEKALADTREKAAKNANAALEKAKQQGKGKGKGKENKAPKQQPTLLEINMRDKNRFMREAVENGTDLSTFFDCCAHQAWFVNKNFDQIEDITHRAYDRAMTRPRMAYTICDLDTLLSQLHDWYHDVGKMRLQNVHMDAAMYRAYVHVLGPDAYQYTSYVDPQWIPGGSEDSIRAYLKDTIPDEALLGPDGETEVWPRQQLNDHLFDIVNSSTNRPYATRPIANVLQWAFESTYVAPPPPPSPLTQQQEPQQYERVYDLPTQGQGQGRNNNKTTKSQGQQGKPKSVLKQAYQG
jgi:hypothetical protein